jgi:beta-glucanase (GH16 family)
MVHRPVRLACLLAWAATCAACSDDTAAEAPGEDAAHETGSTSGDGSPEASLDSAQPGSGDAASPDQNSTEPDAGVSDGAANTEADTNVDIDAARADGAGSSDAAMGDDGSRPGWRLVWHDEFDGPAGSAPDPSKWNAQNGRNNANGELEYYTARPSNLALDGNGNLVITAQREAYMGSAYTSARINTSGKFEQMYGRFEARLQLPGGQGMWPAFWMLGNNAGQVGWPACGEIDIMENVGRSPETSSSSLHGPGYSGGNPLTASYHLTGGFTTAFHVFALEWEQNVVRFYVDDNLFETRTPADLAARGGNLKWVYDHPFNIILNVAVGGGFPGNPNASTPFPQMLLADYVRVYSR